MKIFNFFSALSISLFSLFTQAQIEPTPRPLGLNDISILMPLPRNMEEMNQFLQPASQLVAGQKNVLIPRSVYNMLPSITTSSQQDQHYNHNLRVVAIRFDPCFTEGFTPAACQPQIRLVWQPIFLRSNAMTGELKPGTLDQALHTFYNLTQAEWLSLKAELQQLSSTDPDAALQIHPTLQAERFNGPYWAGLKEIVLKHAGKDNLVRTTIMIMRGGIVWAFRGLDFKNGKWERMLIPTLKDPKGSDVEIINNAFIISSLSLAGQGEFKGGSSTFMEFYNPTWANLLADGKKFRETQSEEEIQSAIRMAIQFENPNQHNPATTDCVSCHIAQTVRLWGKNNFPDWSFENLFAKDQFVSTKFNLSNTSVNPSRVDRVRAFGYFNDEPIISQRVINETAQILSAE